MSGALTMPTNVMRAVGLLVASLAWGAFGGYTPVLWGAGRHHAGGRLSLQAIGLTRRLDQGPKGRVEGPSPAICRQVVEARSLDYAALRSGRRMRTLSPHSHTK